MQTNRRAFLQHLSAMGIVSVGGGVPPGFLVQTATAAQQQSGSTNEDRVLVLVQLAGGNDGLNTVVPYGDPAYQKARPGIGISKGSVLKIDDYSGLHPTMQGFKEIYDEGRLAIVQGVGYPNPNRSHFRSMDIWHTAHPDKEYTQDGWIGRTLDQSVEEQPGNFPALAFGTDKLPLALVSSKVNVPTVRNLSAYQLQLGKGDKQNQELHKKALGQLAQRTAQTGSNLEFLRKTALTAFSSAERLKQITSTYKPAASYPQSRLAQKLKVVAQIIASDLGTRIIFVSLGGFDTHSKQEAAHRALLSELSSAIRAFQLDLQGHRLQDRVLLATFSEFGRRVKENGSLGTDHGAASQMFVVTSDKKGGLYGKHPSLTDLQQGDLKFHTDFRAVYATLLDEWLEIPSQKVLGRSFPTIGFV